MICFLLQSNKELVELYKLKPPEFFNYLNQSGCIRIEGVNDARKFDALRLAFSVLRIPLNMCDGIFCVLSAILWLGNTKFQVGSFGMMVEAIFLRKIPTFMIYSRFSCGRISMVRNASSPNRIKKY